DSNVPNVSIENLSSSYVSSSGSAINSATISWRTNRSGEFTIRESAGDCSSGTIVTGPTAVTANNIQEFVRKARSHFSGEGTKNYRICVKTDTDLEGYATFNLTRDDTAPIVPPSVGSGNFGVATSISLSCSDIGGSGCSKIVYNKQTDSPPANP